MKVVFIDTATTGLWLWRADKFHPEQPHLLRLAIMRDGQRDLAPSVLVKPPPGVIVEAGAVAFHGITQAMADGTHITSTDALENVLPALAEADRIVAHSAAYHRMVLEASIARAGLLCPDGWKERWYCTMIKSADLVQVALQGNGRWKWPKLHEAYRHFTLAALPQEDDPRAAGQAQVRAVAAVYDGIQLAGERAA